MNDIPRYHTIGTLWPEDKLPKGHTLGRGPLVLYSDHEASRAKDKARIDALEWLVEVQERYAVSIMDMGNTSRELRTCAMNELGLSYMRARIAAGIPVEPNGCQNNSTRFGWSTVNAATEAPNA